MTLKKNNGSIKNKINAINIVEAIKASILNEYFCCKISKKNNGILYKFKYFIWITVLILCSPYKNIQTKKFICVPSKLTDLCLREYSENNEYFKFSLMNKSIKDIRNNISVFSPYIFLKRIRIMFEGIVFYLVNRNELKGNWHYTIEYYVIAYYVIDKKIEEITLSGSYDRYSTFLSYLGKTLNIKIIGVQEGAIIDIKPPAKIYRDEMYVFDEYEGNIMKKLIMNEDCKFTNIGFKSTLEFTTFNKTKKYLIGVASQDWFTDKTIGILYNLMNELDSNVYQVVVFPHYRETEEQYKKFKEKYPDLIVKTGSRYSNIDILITFYSTIVYDFWSINKDLFVICQHIEGYRPAYYDRKNVKVVNNTNGVVQATLEYFAIPNITGKNDLYMTQSKQSGNMSS